MQTMQTVDTGVPVLIIDDDRAYVEALHRNAQRFGIELRHAGNLEDAREIVLGDAGAQLCGVILDVICLRERGQRVPDNSFIIAASRFLADKAPHLPAVVLTGEPAQYKNLSELFRGTMAVFSKGKGEDDLLRFLAGEAAKLDGLKYRTRHPEVFSVVGRYLTPEAEQELIGIFKQLESNDLNIIRAMLGSLRRLQETVYLTLNRVNKTWVPDQLIVGEIKVTYIYKHLAEQGLVERYRIIDRFSELIYKITSDNGAHATSVPPRYLPTRYTVQAVTCAICDLLLWFGSVMAAQETAPDFYKEV